MERFGVGRSTVREAFAVLEALGVIELSQGKGAFIRVEPIESLQFKIDSVLTPDRLAEAWDLICALTIPSLPSIGAENFRHQRDKLQSALQQAGRQRRWTVKQELTHLLNLIDLAGNRLMLHVAEQAARLVTDHVAEKQLPPSCINTHETVLGYLETYQLDEAIAHLRDHVHGLRHIVSGS